jgi:Na+/H+ antiporter NhaC
MLRPYIGYCWLGLILLSLIIWAIAGYAYRANAKRAAEGPDKKDFRLVAVYLAPLTWLPLILLSILFFVVRALLYAIFLILFMFTLMVFRKPFLLFCLDKTARKVGDKLLKANTFLIRMAFGKWEEGTRPI